MSGPIRHWRPYWQSGVTDRYPYFYFITYAADLGQLQSAPTAQTGQKQVLVGVLAFEACQMLVLFSIHPFKEFL
jgi:hypothetical protein